MNTILIGGLSRSIKYGRKAMGKIMRLVGAKSLSGDQVNKLDEVPPSKWGEFVLAGLETGAQIEGTDCITLAELNEALDIDMSIYFNAQKALLKDLVPTEIDPEKN